MAIRYVADLYMDIGERVHIKCEVKPVCGQDIPFTVKDARWELNNPDGLLEASGACTVDGHVLDTLVQPKETGWYRFKYIYEVADEIWIDVLRIKVN